MIRQATHSDARDFARVHFESGVEGVLGLLPYKLLVKHFYEPFLQSQLTSKLVYVDEEGAVRATLICLENPTGNSILSFQNVFTIAFQSLLLSLKQPRILLLLINHVKSLNKVSKLNLGVDLVELQILLVDREAQGKGYGRDLLAFWQSIPRGRPCLLYVKTQSKRASAFYEREGFELISCTKTMGAKIYLLTKEILNVH